MKKLCLSTLLAFGLFGSARAQVSTNDIFVQFSTSMGRFCVELYNTYTPNTVANFLSYTTNGVYNSSIIHRSVPGFVIQGGGYYYSTDFAAIPTNNAILSEASLSNSYGTIAMALVGTNSNSATSQWFINLSNNSSFLDKSNSFHNPAFTVFGKVLGDGTNIINAIALLPTTNFGGAFAQLPIQGTTNGQQQLYLTNLVEVYSVNTLYFTNISSSYTKQWNNQFGYYINNDNNAVIFYYIANSTLLSIPSLINGVPLVSIASYSFAGCSNITTINLPNSLKSIGDGAFKSTGISNITIPKAVTQIGDGNGDGVFQYCSNLRTITIPEGVTNITANCFAWCTNLASISLPSTITSISDGAFHDTGLTNILIPNQMTQIGDGNSQYGIFQNCTNLVSAQISEGITNINPYSFYSCYALKNINLPNSLLTLGDGAFCSTGLTNVTIPKGVTQIGDGITGAGVFEDCSNLTIISIPEGVTNIAANCFAWCSNIINITLPSSIITIGNGAFKGTGITNITIPAGVLQIGDGLSDSPFAYCTNLGSVTFSSGIINIPSNAFALCSSLTNVIIPSGVVSIGDYAFSECSGLTNLVIPKGVTLIGNNAFNGCSGLTNIVIPSGVETIQEKAFKGCIGLTNIVIPRGVTSIGLSAFSDCTNLTTITLPNSVISFGSGAFSGCSNLKIVNASDDLLRYLSANRYNLGLDQETVSFVSPLPGSNLPQLISNLLSSVSFLTGLAINPSFLAPLTAKILSDSNNYGLATKTDVSAINVGITGLSNSTYNSILSTSQTFSNVLSSSISALSAQTSPTNPVFVSQIASNQTFISSVASNPAFIASLSTNQVFINALAAHIISNTNNLGIAVKLPQTLNFSPIPTITYSRKKVASVELKAVSSGNLTNTSYSVLDTNVGIINTNSKLIVLGKGTTTVMATNSGNGIYQPASASQRLIVK